MCLHTEITMLCVQYIKKYKAISIILSVIQYKELTSIKTFYFRGGSYDKLQFCTLSKTNKGIVNLIDSDHNNTY